MYRSYFIALSLALFLSSCGSDEPGVSPEDQVETKASIDLSLSAETAWNNCTANWVARLDTNHLTPQWYSGDTHAAYGLFAFKGNRRNRYVFKVKGRVPDARFFSYESYEGPMMAIGDHIFDHEITGNPSGYTASMNAGQEYNLLVYSPEDRFRPTTQLAGYKHLELTKSKIRKTIKTVMFRIYAPENQKSVTLADFPQVYAYDPYTGQPKACPRVHNFKPFDIPQQIVTAMRGAKTSRTLDFENPPKWFSAVGLGTNSAVSEYVINTTRMENPNDVAVVQFRAPYYSTKEMLGNVRYWSFCFPNFAENTTLSCLPDYIAQKDQGKMITVVYGRPNAAVQAEAERQGYYFMPDTRRTGVGPADLQKINSFVYRNMVTSDQFAPYSYQGDYRPRGKICNIQEFMNPGMRSFACLRN